MSGTPLAALPILIVLATVSGASPPLRLGP